MRFKPKIKNIISDYDMDPVLFVPKNGGLKGILSDTLKEMGIDYLSFEKKDRDTYTDDTLTVNLYRGEDIPQITEDFYFDKRLKAIGFTGDDLFDEYMLRNPGSLLSILETVDWYDDEAMFGRPTLCRITRKGEEPKGDVKIAVNRKYELTSRIAIDEVKDNLGINPEIRVYSGNTELTVAEGINDMCFEIVDRGNTVKRYDMVIREKIRSSDFVLVGVDESNPKVSLNDYTIIKQRVDDPKSGSYTSNLASSLNKTIKKIGEESAEFIRAITEYEADKTPENMQKALIEFPDMLYTMNIAMARMGVDFKDITREMYRRIKRD